MTWIALYLAIGLIYAIVNSDVEDWQWSRWPLWVCVIGGWPWIMAKGLMR